jgi:hypothetical protein
VQEWWSHDCVVWSTHALLFLCCPSYGTVAAETHPSPDVTRPHVGCSAAYLSYHVHCKYILLFAIKKLFTSTTELDHFTCCFVQVWNTVSYCEKHIQMKEEGRNKTLEKTAKWGRSFLNWTCGSDSGTVKCTVFVWSARWRCYTGTYCLHLQSCSVSHASNQQEAGSKQSECCGESHVLTLSGMLETVQPQQPCL